MREFCLACVLACSVGGASAAGADTLFGDPAPMPAELIDRLKQEGTREVLDSVSSRSAIIDTRARAIDNLVSRDGFLRGNTTRDLAALRVQLKELVAEQKRVKNTPVSYRSHNDGKVREEALNPGLASGLEKRIAALKDIVFGLEAGDISAAQAAQLSRPRVDGQASRHVYYDPRPQLNVDLQPNWGPRAESSAIDTELERQQAEREAGRVVPVVIPHNKTK